MIDAGKPSSLQMFKPMSLWGPFTFKHVPSMLQHNCYVVSTLILHSFMLTSVKCGFKFRCMVYSSYTHNWMTHITFVSYYSLVFHFFIFERQRERQRDRDREKVIEVGWVERTWKELLGKGKTWPKYIVQKDIFK